MSRIRTYFLTGFTITDADGDISTATATINEIGRASCRERV